MSTVANQILSDIEFNNKLTQQLSIPNNRKPLVLDLFAGCGGLALGFESQGFETIGFEKKNVCVNTYNKNLKGVCHEVELTPDFDFPIASVIVGGPPCQPFSVGGNQAGLKDSRDGFPTFLAAVKNIQPDLFMFENVRGLLYKNSWYLNEIIEYLESLKYVVTWKLLNAVDYGVPQNRERVIVVGHRGRFEFPKSESKRFTAGEALGEKVFSMPPESKVFTPSMDKYVAKYEKASQCKTPRDLHLNKPARTLTCRNLAGATGDMHRIRMPNGTRRRMLPQEAQRLQTFPDWFKFSGNENDIFYQLGNAVPPMFAKHLAGAVRKYLASEVRLSESEILKTHGSRQKSFWKQEK